MRQRETQANSTQSAKGQSQALEAKCVGKHNFLGDVREGFLEDAEVLRKEKKWKEKDIQRQVVPC